MTELTEERVREITREEIVKFERETAVAVYGLFYPPQDTKKKRKT